MTYRSCNQGAAEPPVAQPRPAFMVWLVWRADYIVVAFETLELAQQWVGSRPNGERDAHVIEERDVLDRMPND